MGYDLLPGRKWKAAFSRSDQYCDDHLIVHEALSNTVAVLTNSANAAFSWIDDATMAAQTTLHLLVFPRFLKKCLSHAVNPLSIT